MVGRETGRKMTHFRQVSAVFGRFRPFSWDKMAVSGRFRTIVYTVS